MSFLERTHQLWKLYLFVALMALGAVITLLQSVVFRYIGEEWRTYVVIGGMVLVTGVFAWAFNSIRCPNCQHKLFWHSIVKVGLGTWFNWLTTEEACPQCGSRDGRPPAGKKRGKVSGKGK